METEGGGRLSRSSRTCSNQTRGISTPGHLAVMGDSGHKSVPGEKLLGGQRVQ